MEAIEKKDPLAILAQHALPLALAALTVAGVAGYAAGRAYLEGWYSAAGVSPLVFSWEAQYVVLRGLASDVLWLWLGGLGTLSLIIFLFGAIDVIVDWLRERSTKKRSAEPVAEISTKEAKREYGRRFAVVFLLAYLPLAVALVWFVFAKLLTSMPRQQGQRDFLAMHMAATCQFPAWVHVNASDSKIVASLRDEGMASLQTYRWVEVQSPALTAPTRGWLLQLQGSTALLLSTSGTDLLVFGDSQFKVSTADEVPPVCELVPKQARSARPTFRADAK